MKEIIFNDNNLKDSDIEKTVIRVKGLIVNSRNKLLLVYNNYTYQLPGGHLKDKEEIDGSLKREIKEEIGIDVVINEAPFLCIKTYDNDYCETGSKVLNIIYYYRIITDELPNINYTHYDELELLSDFKLYYVSLSGIRSFLKKAMNAEDIEASIYKEMMTTIDIYEEIYGRFV